MSKNCLDALNLQSVDLVRVYLLIYHRQVPVMSPKSVLMQSEPEMMLQVFINEKWFCTPRTAENMARPFTVSKYPPSRVFCINKLPRGYFASRGYFAMQNQLWAPPIWHPHRNMIQQWWGRWQYPWWWYSSFIVMDVLYKTGCLAKIDFGNNKHSWHESQRSTCNNQHQLIVNIIKEREFVMKCLNRQYWKKKYFWSTTISYQQQTHFWIYLR